MGGTGSKIIGIPEKLIEPGTSNVKIHNFTLQERDWLGRVTNTVAVPASVKGYEGTVDTFLKDGSSYTIDINLKLPEFPLYKIGIKAEVVKKNTNLQLNLNYTVNDKSVSENKITIDPQTVGNRSVFPALIYPDKKNKVQFIDFFIEAKSGNKLGLQWIVDPALVGKPSSGNQSLLTNSVFVECNPFLNIVWYSDDLGSNLGEILCVVEGDYLPQDRYPTKLIGKYSWFNVCSSNLSYFSKYPNFMKVMKGIPTRTYYQKAEELNDTSLTTTIFYENLLSFMSVRYFLGGLSSGCLSTKWLLQNNTKKLYENILDSCFAKFITILTETYKGYDLYMRVC
jgi:hypothetical protein